MAESASAALLERCHAAAQLVRAPQQHPPTTIHASAAEPAPRSCTTAAAQTVEELPRAPEQPQAVLEPRDSVKIVAGGKLPEDGGTIDDVAEPPAWFQVDPVLHRVSTLLGPQQVRRTVSPNGVCAPFQFTE